MIDKNPVVGRFLFRESMLRDGFFQRAGVITRISGKRVYYSDYRYVDHEDGEMESFIHVKTITAVCDTSEEIDTLTDFNRRALDEVSALKNAHKAEARAFFEKGKDGL